MQKLSVTLNNVDTELQENRAKIKILIENNDVLNIKVKSLEKKIDKQEIEIDDLKEENSKLKRTINYFENLFDRLVKFIKNKMFAKEKNEKIIGIFQKIYILIEYLVMIQLNQLRMIIFGIRKMIKRKKKMILG